MSDGFYKIKKGANIGSQASDPANGVEGDVYTNSGTSKTRQYINGAWRDAVTADDAQTLTNKTIDATPGVNTLSNVQDANVKVGANIALAKLAPVATDKALVSDGSGVISPSIVTSAELAELSGITSAAVGVSDTQTLTNKSIDSDLNTITNIANSEIKVGANIDRLKLAPATPNNVVINDSLGQLISEAQLAPSRGGTGVANASNLSYGPDNVTLTTTANSNVTLPTTGTLATLAGVETLSNKTLVSPTVDIEQFPDQVSVPATPAPGTTVVYSLAGEMYRLNSTGDPLMLGYDGSGTQLRILSVPASTRVIVTGANRTSLDGSISVKEMEGKLISFDGAQIDFGSGTIYAIDGITVTGSFTPATIASGNFHWSAISLIAGPVNADNTQSLIIDISEGASDNTTAATATKADFVDGGIPVGQVSLSNVGGVLQNISQTGVDQIYSGAGGGSSSKSWKNSVDLASTTDTPLTGAAPLVLDGVTVVDGMRLLLKNQSVLSDNGVHEAAVAGGSYTLFRAKDANSSTQFVDGMVITVVGGDVNALSMWMLNATNPIVLGTTPLQFEKIAGTTAIVQEVPSGTVDGSNANFVLTRVPLSAASVQVFLDEKIQPSSTWSLAGQTITFGVGNIPAPGQTVYAVYFVSIGPMSYTIPAGATLAYAGNVEPSGYLICDGSAVGRAAYTDLFAAIGTTWGVGDGTTTFNLPDLQGRAPIGAGTGSGLTTRTLGDLTIGEETHQLSQAEMPAHVHSYTHAIADNPGPHFYAGGGFQLNLQGANTDSAGGDVAHNNMQPSAVVNFIIKF